MKKLIALLLVLVMVLGLVACGAKEAPKTEEKKEETSAPATEEKKEETKTEEKTEETEAAAEDITIRFSWWGSQTRHDLTMKVVELYQKENPNVHFEMEYLSGPDYNTKLATQAATNQMPDIFQTDIGWISSYIDMGVIADMGSFLTDGTIDTTNISDNVIALGKTGGVQYAMPLALNTTSMFYDKDVAAAAGYEEIPYDWTWEDYDAMLNDVYTKTGTPALPLYYHIPEALMEVVARQEGYQMWNADGSALGFDAAVAELLFQRIADLTASGAYAPADVWSTSTTTEDNGLVLGTAWTAYGGSNQLASYLATAGEGRNLGITTLPLSAASTADPVGSFVKPSMMMSISSSASPEVQAVCADFLNFFLNNLESGAVLGVERGVPVNTEVRAAVAGSVDAVAAEVMKYVAFVEENCAAPGAAAPSNSAEVYSVLVDLYMSVAFGVTTPADAAEQFVTQANSILAANA